MPQSSIAQQSTRSPSAVQPFGWGFALGIALVIAIGLGLRLGTNVTSRSPTFDERWIIVPINDLIQQGWSVKTAIDFEETKGPGMIWLYAIAAKAVGTSLNDLRLVSVVLFMLGAIPLLDMARRCGMRNASLAMVALTYALLPYHAAVSQLVMSEGSYVAFMLMACWVAVVGVSPRDDAGSGKRQWVLAIAFGVLLSILLHNRIHAVVLAGAVTLTAIQAMGWRRATPWIVACTLAGFSRIPLWLRWGGLVSPRWQEAMQLGFGMDAMVYLLAALAPVVAVFVWVAIARPELRSRWWWCALAGGVGAALVFIAPPDLAAYTPMIDQNLRHFSGIAATTTKTISATPWIHTAIMAAIAAASAAGVAGLWAVSAGVKCTDRFGVVVRVEAWLVLIGPTMYAFTDAPAFDRYIVGWIVLLPIVWVRTLPRAALIVQMIVLAAIAVWLCRTWLM
jgi:hypothetical protein